MINRFSAVLCATVLVFTSITMSATNIGEIKTRMKARIPVIKELKVKGVIGENCQGYLEFRTQKTKEDIVNGENADRKLIYHAIAKQQGVTEAKVGERRAIQIKSKSSAGMWFKDRKGNWSKK